MVELRILRDQWLIKESLFYQQRDLKMLKQTTYTVLWWDSLRIILYGDWNKKERKASKCPTHCPIERRCLGVLDKEQQ